MIYIEVVDRNWREAVDCLQGEWEKPIIWEEGGWGWTKRQWPPICQQLPTLFFLAPCHMGEPPPEEKIIPHYGFN
jgi:hypothetical protein